LDYKLNTTELIIFLLFMLHVLLITIAFMRYYLNQKGRKELQSINEGKRERPKYLINKYDVINVNKWSKSILLGCVVFSLVTMAALFSYTVKKQLPAAEMVFELLPQDLINIDNRIVREIKPKEMIQPKPKKSKAPPIIRPKEKLAVVKLPQAKAPVQEITPNTMVYQPTLTVNVDTVTKEVEPEIEKPKPSNKVMIFAEEMPRFPSTDTDQASKTALLKHIYKHLKYPVLAREAGIEGMAVIRFVINKSGEITQIKILKNPGGGTGEAAVDALKSIKGNWEPGKQSGHLVNVALNLPVRFELRD